MKHRKTDNLRIDCFAFRGCEFQQFCTALAGVKNCVGCKFHKTKEQIEKEEERTKRRLEKMGAYYDLNRGRFVNVRNQIQGIPLLLATEKQKLGGDKTEKKGS